MTNKLDLKCTSLFVKHLEAKAKMVEFAGWEMPINYGSQVKEHQQVREDAGMFDVSHMVVIDFKGTDAKRFLQRILANDVARLKEKGKALYSAMLNHSGGIIDDLIIYYLTDGEYRMVINASTRDKVRDWILGEVEGFMVRIIEGKTVGMISVQGPNAREKVYSVLLEEDAEKVKGLEPFSGVPLSRDRFIARTGYTGEDGFEIMLPEVAAPALWDKLLEAGVQPIGLGARDTLRLEAGMNLYGTDMDETVTPLSSGMAWTVAFDPAEGEDQDRVREFIGRPMLEREVNIGSKEKLMGLVLEDKGVLRGGQKVITEQGEGVITSGSFSPTLGFSIALARIPVDATGECQVEIRGKKLSARIVKPPFVRNGKSLV